MHLLLSLNTDVFLAFLNRCGRARNQSDFQVDLTHMKIYKGI